MRKTQLEQAEAMVQIRLMTTEAKKAPALYTRHLCGAYHGFSKIRKESTKAPGPIAQLDAGSEARLAELCGKPR